MPVLELSGTDDPRLADYRNVPDPELLRSRGLFIAEGRHVVRRLLASSRFRTRSLLLTPAALAGLGDVVVMAGGAPVFVVSQAGMNGLTGFNIHRGCLAVGERGAEADWCGIAAAARRLVVLEGVSNADNVGGIFRNAAAFGADAVLLGPSCADPLYRKAIRTSMGAALRVPFARLDPWPDGLARLRASGFHLVALTPAVDAAPLAASRPGANRAALLLGHEGDGLSSEALRHADARARIPMADGVDSLNVTAAAAVALYEWSR